jgi:hypothetical protein
VSESHLGLGALPFTLVLYRTGQLAGVFTPGFLEWDGDWAIMHRTVAGAHAVRSQLLTFVSNALSVLCTTPHSSKRAFIARAVILFIRLLRLLLVLAIPATPRISQPRTVSI